MIEARAYNFKDARGWGIKLPAGTQAEPGQVVNKNTSKGTFQVTLGAYQGTNEYGDLLWTDNKGNGAGGGTGPGQFSPGPQSSGQAPPAPASTGPAGPVLASSMVQAALSAYADAILAEWPAEQAGSLACTIAIGVQRGAVNDLVDADPFAGN